MMNTFRREQEERDKGPRCENHPRRDALHKDEHGEYRYCEECFEAIQEGRL